MSPILDSYMSSRPRSALIMMAAVSTTYILVEKGLAILGGDTGAFLYTTGHFVLMPILSALLIVFQAIHLPRQPNAKDLIWLSISLIVPGTIILIAISGNPIMFDVLHINFNR